jgi:hypothetical protein
LNGPLEKPRLRHKDVTGWSKNSEVCLELLIDRSCILFWTHVLFYKDFKCVHKITKSVY